MLEQVASSSTINERAEISKARTLRHKQTKKTTTKKTAESVGVFLEFLISYGLGLQVMNFLYFNPLYHFNQTNGKHTTRTDQESRTEARGVNWG